MSRSKLSRKALAVLSTAVATTIIVQNVNAGTIYWYGTGIASTKNWDDANVWSSSQASNVSTGTPASTDSVYFDVTGVTGTQNISLNGDRTIVGATFAQSNVTENLNGANTLSVGTGGLTVSAGTVTINPAITLTGTQAWTHTGGNLFKVGAVNVNGQALTVAGAGAGMVQMGNLSGGGSITVNRLTQKVLVLAGTSNTYSGTIGVTAGYLGFASAGAYSGIGTANSISVTNNTAYSSGLVATYAIDNAFLLGTVNATTAANSFVVALGANSSNALDFSGGSGVSMANASLGSVGNFTYSGTLTANGTTYRLGGVGGTLTMAGQLTGAGNSLSIAPASAVTLAPTVANTFGGGITVQAGGTLNTTTGGVGNASGLTFVSGGTLATNGSTLNIAVPITITAGNLGITTTNDISLTGTLGGGAFTKGGAGTLTLGGTTDNTLLSGTLNAGTVALAKTSSSTVHALNGLVVLNGATLQLGGTGGDQIADSVTVGVNTGTFDLKGQSEGISVLSGTGLGFVTNSGGADSTLTLGANNASGAFIGEIQDGTSKVVITKAGTGTATFSGINSYTGGTNIQNGTLLVASGAVQTGLAATAVTNASKNITLSSVAGLAVGQTIVNANLVAGTVITSINTATKVIGVSNNYTGTTGTANFDITTPWQSLPSAGVVTFGTAGTAGTLDLAGSTTTVAGLSVAAGATAASQIIGSSSTTAASTLAFAGTNSTFAGTIKDKVGTGTQKVGLTVNSGVLSLTGTDTYTGATQINGGSLLVGVAGVGSITSTVTAASGGTLGGSGKITTNSNQNVSILGGAKLTPGASSIGTLTIDAGTGQLDISAAVASGTGSMLFDLDTVANSDKVLLSNVASVLNIGSGKLEFSDFTFTTTANLADQTSYTLFDTSATISGSLAGSAFLTGALNANFNGTLALGDNGHDVVLNVVAAPEPASLSVLGLAAAGLLQRRRRSV